jgi:hypothetical protein
MAMVKMNELVYLKVVTAVAEIFATVASLASYT